MKLTQSLDNKKEQILYNKIILLHSSDNFTKEEISPTLVNIITILKQNSFDTLSLFEEYLWDFMIESFPDALELPMRPYKLQHPEFGELIHSYQTSDWIYEGSWDPTKELSGEYKRTILIESFDEFFDYD